MRLNTEKLGAVANIVGDTYYIFNENIFIDNYNKMLKAFRKKYNNTYIAYSYKTNYIPIVCKYIKELGGYAEVVSEMEIEMAEAIGVESKDIYYNGPYKKFAYFERLLLQGGNINIDAEYELDYLDRISQKYKDIEMGVGIRCCLDIGQQKPSRFGFDLSNGTLQAAISRIGKMPNIRLKGLHCHLPYRNLDSFRKRRDSFIDMYNKLVIPKTIEYISFGGGYMGEVSKELKSSLSNDFVTFDDYAEVVGNMMNELFGILGEVKLIIEPGTALVANTMQLVSKVVSIKENRNKAYVTLSASTYNMNPSVKGINRPIKIFHNIECEAKNVINADFVGYTCIEGDVLYSGYNGIIAEGDYVVFSNVGSYSVVMKPPFILPDIAIVSGNNMSKIYKRAQKVESIINSLE